MTTIYPKLYTSDGLEKPTLTEIMNIVWLKIETHRKHWQGTNDERHHMALHAWEAVGHAWNAANAIGLRRDGSGELPLSNGQLDLLCKRAVDLGDHLLTEALKVSNSLLNKTDSLEKNPTLTN